MADFYPLIVKGVSALAPDASGENRRELYDRVREVLLTELRTADPPFTDFQIMRERLALEDAVSRVEGEAAAAGSKLADAEPSVADADDTGIGVEIPLMILTGGASGRFNRVWRYAWR